MAGLFVLRTVEGLACGLGLVTVLTTHCVVIHCRTLRVRGAGPYEVSLCWIREGRPLPYGEEYYIL